MSKVTISKFKLDYLANCIATKSGESTPLTLDEMAAVVMIGLLFKAVIT